MEENHPQEENKEVALRTILEGAAGTPEIADQAHRQLMDAVSDYNAMRLAVFDQSGARETELAPGVAKTRGGLRKLARSAKKARTAFEAIPLPARLTLAKSTGMSFGEMSRMAAKFEAVTRLALHRALRLENKPPDYARDLLACEVARVVRATLKEEPSRTRDTEDTITGARGGALYARILRATLAIVGIEPKYIDTIINAGLQHLGPPEGS